MSKRKRKHTRTKADDILDMIADRMHTPPDSNHHSATPWHTCTGLKKIACFLEWVKNPALSGTAIATPKVSRCAFF